LYFVIFDKLNSNNFDSIISCNTINGIIADYQKYITLIDNSSTPSNCGIYFIMVRPTTAIATRPSAIFAIGRLCGNVCGQVQRLIGIKGVNNDNLDIQWGINVNPSLLYRPAGGTNSTTQYTIKIITV